MLQLLQTAQKLKPMKVIPVRQTISNNIPKIYDQQELLIIRHLQNAPEVIAVILDLWTDGGVKLSYISKRQHPILDKFLNRERLLANSSVLRKKKTWST